MLSSNHFDKETVKTPFDYFIRDKYKLRRECFSYLIKLLNTSRRISLVVSGVKIFFSRLDLELEYLILSRRNEILLDVENSTKFISIDNLNLAELHALTNWVWRLYK